MATKKVSHHKDIQDHFARQAAQAPQPNGRVDRALRSVLELAKLRPDDEALDVASGPGATALALACQVRSVVAADITEAMVERTRLRACEEGRENVTVQQAPAEDLPFAEGTYSLVTCCFAAHHFKDLEKAVDEMVRVLQPGGRLVICDTASPPDEPAAVWMNDVEARRDRTHRRNRQLSEWEQLFARRGLTERRVRRGKSEIDFIQWTRSAATPASAVMYLERDIRMAEPEIASAFGIKITRKAIRLAWDYIAILGTKPR